MNHVADDAPARPGRWILHVQDRTRWRIDLEGSQAAVITRYARVDKQLQEVHAEGVGVVHDDVHGREVVLRRGSGEVKTDFPMADLNLDLDDAGKSCSVEFRSAVIYPFWQF